MFNPIEVANEIYDYDPHNPYAGSERPKEISSTTIQPQQTIKPRPSVKETVALQLYMVTTEHSGPQGITLGGQTQYIVLAKNNSEAKKAIKTQYKAASPLRCALIPGPFKNGTVLMRREV